MECLNISVLSFNISPFIKKGKDNFNFEAFKDFLSQLLDKSVPYIMCFQSVKTVQWDALYELLTTYNYTIPSKSELDILTGPVNFVAIPNYLNYDGSLITHKIICLAEPDNSINKVDIVELTITNNAKQYKFHICSVNLLFKNDENKKSREGFIDKLLYEVSRYFPNPVILCGTFVDEPDSDSIKKLSNIIFSNINKDNNNTYFVSGKKKCSDYIFIYNTIIKVFYIPPGIKFVESLSVIHSPLLCNLCIPSVFDIQSLQSQPVAANTIQRPLPVQYNPQQSPPPSSSSSSQYSQPQPLQQQPHYFHTSISQPQQFLYNQTQPQPQININQSPFTPNNHQPLTIQPNTHHQQQQQPPFPPTNNQSLQYSYTQNQLSFSSNNNQPLHTLPIPTTINTNQPQIQPQHFIQTQPQQQPIPIQPLQYNQQQSQYPPQQQYPAYNK